MSSWDQNVFKRGRRRETLHGQVLESQDALQRRALQAELIDGSVSNPCSTQASTSNDFFGCIWKGAGAAYN
jgi:hypothetical protein